MQIRPLRTTAARVLGAASISTAVVLALGALSPVAAHSASFNHRGNLLITDQFNNQFVTGFLSLIPDPGGPHPYSNDFFYQGTLSSALFPGRTYNVFLNAPNTNCTPGFVGQISV